MGSPCLPVELTDRIIDFCHGKKWTLSSCALTHSSWLPTSRFHLFHTVTWSGSRRKTHRVTELESIIRDGTPTVSGRLPSILSYIKIVKIDSSRSDRGTQLEKGSSLAHAINQFCDLERLPAPFVHVSLNELGFGPGRSLRQSLSLVCDVVIHLKLSNVTFAHPDDIWSFLSSFPRLQHLELFRVGFVGHVYYDLPAETRFNNIPLSTLRINTVTMGYIIRSLVKMAASLSYLDDFGITYQDITQEELPQLAEAIRGTVKCLRFSASCYPGHDRDESRPSASDIRIPEFVGRFRSLHTLVLDNLTVDGSSGYGRSDLSYRWIPGVLQQVSSPIRRLVFEVTATSYLQFKAIPWASIDKIVTPGTPQFRELARVEVLVKRGSFYKSAASSIGRNVVCSEIMRRLPRLNRLGLLRCDTSGR